MKLRVLPSAIALIGTPVFTQVIDPNLAAAIPSRNTSMTLYEAGLACDRQALSRQARKRHDERTLVLLKLNNGVRELPNGFAVEFPSDPATLQLISQWAADERLCCPFFNIELKHEGAIAWLDLTGREGAKQFIQAQFSGWFQK